MIRAAVLASVAVSMLLGPALAGGAAAADGWTGRLGAAWIWQDASDNEDAFFTQHNLDQGFQLEDLDLRYGGDGQIESLRLDASGFGAAWPSQSVRLDLGLHGGLDVFAVYDRRESYFHLAGGDLRQRSDDWSIERWKAGVVIDAWEPLRATVTLRHYRRDGTVRRPLYTQNEFYPVVVDLDESMTEGSLRLETRTLPVRLEFEQSFARYLRENRRRPADPQSIDGLDPDLLLEAATDFRDEQQVPTSRLTASYADHNFEALGTVLWADTDLDSTGAATTVIAVDGGDIGTITRIDDLIGSAGSDSLFGAVVLGFLVTPDLRVRLDGQARESTTDAALMGERLLRGNTPGVEISAPVSDDGFYDVEDVETRLRLEWQRTEWRVWAGFGSYSRDVAWRLSQDDGTFAVKRESDGWLAGATWGPGAWLDIDLEYEQGDFTRYVFRTDPQAAESTQLRLRTRLGGGWQAAAHARHEQADNPADVAGLDFESSPFGVAIDWAAKSGSARGGLGLERLDLQSDTGLVLPDGSAGNSFYDLDAWSATIHGEARFGDFRLHGTAFWLDDGGATWPLESWNVRARVDVIATEHLEWGLFAERWLYDEAQADVDDYEVNRLGLGLTWRFE